MRRRGRVTVGRGTMRSGRSRSRMAGPMTDVADECAQIREPIAVLGRDDEAELMAVLAPALHKLLSICYVGLWPIESSTFSFPGRYIALQVTEMSVGSLARPFQPDDPRLHHHAAHSLAWASTLGRMLQPISRRLASTDTATSPVPGPVPATPTSPSVAFSRPSADRRLLLLPPSGPD